MFSRPRNQRNVLPTTGSVDAQPAGEAATLLPRKTNSVSDGFMEIYAAVSDARLAGESRFRTLPPLCPPPTRCDPYAVGDERWLSGTQKHSRPPHVG